MTTVTVLPEPSHDWDSYVLGAPEASIYHRGGWSLLARDVFGHVPYFVEARDSSGRLCGVLPVVLQKSLLFGRFMTSVPFFNYGGALAHGPEVATLLMERARDMARDLRCSFLELRDARPQPGNWTVRTDKVSMILPLPPDAAALSKQLGAKLRSQIKRAERENVTVRIGGTPLLADFYEVFCRTMRDLGTPVYPRKFFSAIIKMFPAECLLVLVDRAGQPAAAGFMVIANGRAEIPWAGCRNDAKAVGFNMRLYWEVLSAAIERGCTQFDFGRSTTDSGTYKFKKQWGAEPLQLHWHRWERKLRTEGKANAASEGKLMRYATSVWQRLPLSVANTLGPLVSPGLPW